MSRRQPDVRDLMNPNSHFSKEAREYQALVDRELKAAHARGLNGRDAVVEAEYRASVLLPQMQERRRGRISLLIFAFVLLGAVSWMLVSGRFRELSIAQFVPEITSAAVLFALFFVAQGENQRWVRARSRGFQGSNQLFGFFVDLTGFIAMVYGFAWPVAYGFDYGWPSAVGLYLAGWLAMMVVALIMGTVIPLVRSATLSEIDRRMGMADEITADWFMFWILGTIAVWPLMWLLARTVTWFGYLPELA